MGIFSLFHFHCDFLLVLKKILFPIISSNKNVWEIIRRTATRCRMTQILLGVMGEVGGSYFLLPVTVLYPLEITPP